MTYRHVGDAPIGVGSRQVQNGETFDADGASEVIKFFLKIGAIEEVASPPPPPPPVYRKTITRKTAEEDN